MAQTSQWKHKSRLITCFFCTFPDYPSAVHVLRWIWSRITAGHDFIVWRQRGKDGVLALEHPQTGQVIEKEHCWSLKHPVLFRISGDTLAALAFYQHTISNRRKRNMVVHFNVGLNLPLLGCFRLCNICFLWLPSLNRLRRKMASVSLLSFS